MADATIFEERGLQAAAIVTSSFHKSSQSMARRRGYRDYQYVTITHPVSSLDAEGVRERAEQALPQILEILGITDIHEGPAK